MNIFPKSFMYEEFNFRCDRCTHQLWDHYVDLKLERVICNTCMGFFEHPCLIEVLQEEWREEILAKRRDIENRKLFGKHYNKSTTQKDASPIKGFINKCCDFGPELEVTLQKLYPAYELWARANKQEIKNTATFGRELLSAAGGAVKTFRPRDEFGKQVKGYRGLSLKPEIIVNENIKLQAQQ